MSAVPTIDYETIFRIVRSWPPEQRVIFLQDVLRTLVPAATVPQRNATTLDQARGLLAHDRPAPTDDEVAQLLEERRTERYSL